MPEEGFLRRWARVKASGEASGGEALSEAPPAPAAPAPAPVALAEPARPAAPEQPLPTLEDAARLTSDSDFSAFVSQAVDKDVRRLALKKLFADPHFNVLDRLDMYMDDYNKPSPVSAAMLAALDHARGALRRPEEVQAELARLAAFDAPAAVDLAASNRTAEVAAVPEQDLVLAGETGDPDSLVQLQPLAEPDAPADEHAAAPIALHRPDAHNEETQP